MCKAIKLIEQAHGALVDARDLLGDCAEYKPGLKVLEDRAGEIVRDIKILEGQVSSYE